MPLDRWIDLLGSIRCVENLYPVFNVANHVTGVQYHFGRIFKFSAVKQTVNQGCSRRVGINPNDHLS